MLVAVLIACAVAVGSISFLVAQSAGGSRGWRIALPILTSFAFFLCCACLSFAFINPANDVRLWRFKRGLAQIPHPPDSTLLASRSDVGLLVGNGNHCDYFAGQMRQTRLSRQEVEEFYAGVAIPVARVGDGNVPHKPGATVHEPGATVAVRVLFVEGDSRIGPTPGRLPYGLENAQDWGVDVAQHADGLLYVVYALDAGYAPGLDIRCH